MVRIPRASSKRFRSMFAASIVHANGNMATSRERPAAVASSQCMLAEHILFAGKAQNEKAMKHIAHREFYFSRFSHNEPAAASASTAAPAPADATTPAADHAIRESQDTVLEQQQQQHGAAPAAAEARAQATTAVAFQHSWPRCSQRRPSSDL